MIRKHLHEAYQTGKRTIGNMWKHAVNWAGDIDHAFNIGKCIYGALQPAIQDVGGSGINRAVMQGIGRYEDGRNQAMGGFNQVQAHLSRLRRAAPELDL